MKYTQNTLNKLSYNETAIATREFRKSKILINKIRPKWCFICFSKENIELHHIDKNILNNDIDNFVYLCKGCHWKTHKQPKILENVQINRILEKPLYVVCCMLYVVCMYVLYVCIVIEHTTHHKK